MSMKTAVSSNSPSVETIIRTWDTYIVRAQFIVENSDTKVTKAEYANIRCIARNMESAIAHVRQFGLPSDAIIISCTVCPHGVMIAA